MEIGIVGLGRMGGNMSVRLVRGGHRVVGWDSGPAARRALEGGPHGGGHFVPFGEKLLSAMRRQFGGHAEAARGGGAR